MVSVIVGQSDSFYRKRSRHAWSSETFGHTVIGVRRLAKATNSVENGIEMRGLSRELNSNYSCKYLVKVRISVQKAAQMRAQVKCSELK